MNEGKPARQRGRWIKREMIGPPECPIMVRWTVLSTRFGKLLVHRFMPNADDRAVHDHPSSFVTLILRGGYDDCSDGDVAERVRNFNETTGVFGYISKWGATGGNHHPDRCKCQGDPNPEESPGVVGKSDFGGACRVGRNGPNGDTTPHKHRDEPPYSCARCLECDGYEPAVPIVHERMRPGMIRYRPATHTHRTKVGPNGCWTVVLMGPKRREWGFWKLGRWWPWREHERRFGFGMRCPDSLRDALDREAA